MEKPKLSPELQNIIDQLTKFRTKYTHLNTHCAAQEEIIRLQRLESEKMNSRVELLANAFDDHQKYHNATLRNLESENQRLRKIAEEYSREKENAFLLQGRRDEERVCNLEEKIAELQSKLDIESKKHGEEIEALKKSHEEQILVWKMKLEAKQTPERRDYEISFCNPNQFGQNIDVRSTVNPSQKQVKFVHPALEENGSQRKRKKCSAAFKWPPLDFVAKEDREPGRSAITTNKKKLYQADNDMIVDIAN